MSRNNRLHPILVLAASIGHLVSANFIINCAVAKGYSYSDYVVLCKCINRVPCTNHTYMANVQEQHQLSLEGIC